MVADPLDDLLEALLEEQKPPQEAEPGERTGLVTREVEDSEGDLQAGTPIELRAAMKKRVRDLQQLMAVFLKAGKTLRLYSEQHDFFDRFADEFMTRLHDEFATVDSLTFEITPVAINWDGNVVFENREQRENLAFKLYRDGVRLLQFRRGATKEEVREFVTLVAREVDTAGSAAKDLSILFWEADFKHINIAVAETFVEYSVDAARVLADIESDLADLRGRFELVAHRDARRHEPEAYDPHARGIEDEVRRLLADDPWAFPEESPETEIPEMPEEVNDPALLRAVYQDLVGLEDPYATFEEVGTVLAQIVARETDEAELRLLVGHLDDALSPLLATAAIGPLNALLRRIALLRRSGTDQGHFRGQAIRDFFHGFAQPDRLALLAQAIDEDWSDAWKGELFTFASIQTRVGIEALLEFLGQVRTPAPRRVIADALILLADRDPEPFLPLLRSPNGRLAADAVYALGRIGDPRSIDAIVGAFEREEPAVRAEVLQALRPFQSPRIQELMLRALRDAEEEVRLASLRYLAVYKVRESIPLLTQVLGARDFAARTFDEKRGWYITLGHVAGQAAFMAFRKRVEPLRGKDKVTEEGHLALLGIRSIRSPEAGQFLDELAPAVRGDLQILVRRLIRERKAG